MGGEWAAQYEMERETGGRQGESERLSLESVKTIMQTDTLEMRCWLSWQQALGWLEVVVVVAGGWIQGRGEDGRGCEDGGRGMFDKMTLLQCETGGGKRWDGRTDGPLEVFLAREVHLVLRHSEPQFQVTRPSRWRPL